MCVMLTMKFIRLYLFILLLLVAFPEIINNNNKTIFILADNIDKNMMMKSHVVGGYMPIQDLRTNDRVPLIAQFVIEQILLQEQQQQQQQSTLDTQNGNNNGQLPQYSFLSKIKNDASMMSTTVVQGSQQVVAGMNYQLTIVLSTTTESVNDTDTNTNTKNNISSIDIIGAFIVTVYDQFGQLSITNYGKELSYKDAKVLFENYNHFHDEDEDEDEDEDGT
jgi:hypothetical protein